MTKNILVVEDEQSLQDVIRIKLEKSGFNVEVTNSVDGALDAIKKNDKIQAVWLDHYLLGEKNGLDLVINLKNDEKLKNIPIFIVSNTATSDKINSYIGLGIEKYYTKSNFALSEVIEDISQKIK